MKKNLLKIMALCLFCVALIAIYRYNFRKSIPQDVPVEQQLAAIMKQNDCYACHSNEPTRPFYASFPIIGDVVEADIKQAVRFLNLSDVDFARINEADLAKIEQSMINGSMPLLKYKLVHWGTGFNNEEKSVIATWVRDLRAQRFATSLAAPQFANEPLQPLVEKIETDAQKVALGVKLFHDGRISADGTISCATCHPLNTGGVDGLPTSKGIHEQMGGINAPTVYNAFFNHVQFWNGRAANLAEQAAGPPVNPIEMGTQTWDDIVARLRTDEQLVAEFKTIYPEGITEATVTDAIAEFEKTLITPNAPIDKYLKGDLNAMSAVQIEGYELFKKFNCAACHVGQAVGGQSFEYMGIIEDYFEARAKERPEIITNDDDKGRIGFTGKESDLHKFKVPILRNIALTAPYLHDGSAETLKEAVEAMFRFQVKTKYTQNELDKIVEFMNALTGTHPMMQSSSTN